MQRAILHVDGDGFFASCEISLAPSLRDRPVVTGQERGIASAMSPAAKALGITRGMPISQIKRQFPDVAVISSDYDVYSLISRRMYEIVRRYTPDVEEYSIDECFADLTGWQQPRGLTYAQLIDEIKRALQRELGLTFSVGLAPTKSLAKLASNWQKPDGLTIIELPLVDRFLAATPIDKIWGIGYRTARQLRARGIESALDFKQRPFDWIRRQLAKPFQEIWLELHGTAVIPLHTGPSDDQQSIQTTRTFVPTADVDALWSQLTKNVERSCLRARRGGLAPRRIYAFLKTQDFIYHGRELALINPTALPLEIIPQLEPVFYGLYQRGALYRTTGIILQDLIATRPQTLPLTAPDHRHRVLTQLYDHVDRLEDKYGAGIISLASSLRARPRQSPPTDGHTLTDPIYRRHLNLPLLGTI